MWISVSLENLIVKQLCGSVTHNNYTIPHKCSVESNKTVLFLFICTGYAGLLKEGRMKNEMGKELGKKIPSCRNRREGIDKEECYPVMTVMLYQGRSI